MASSDNTIDGQIQEITRECALQWSGLDPGSRVIIDLDPLLQNIESIWLWAYSVDAVPVVGGIPEYPTFYLRFCNLPMLPRIGKRNSPTGNAVPLLINDAYTRYQYQHPIPVVTAEHRTVSYFEIELLDPNGNKAHYDSCTIHLTIVTKSQPTSLARSLAIRPAANRVYDFVARPYIV